MIIDHQCNQYTPDHLSELKGEKIFYVQARELVDRIEKTHKRVSTRTNLDMKL